MKNKIWIGLLAACLLVAVLPVLASAESKVIDSGTWQGKNITWTFYADGTLKIDGYGSFHESRSGYPWGYYYDQVKKLVIGNEITRIPMNAFDCFYQLQSVHLGSSVKSIDTGAFRACVNLKSITIPKSVQTIGSDAFQRCYSLETVNFAQKGELNTIGQMAFAQTGLLSVEIPSGVIVNEQAFYKCYNLRHITIKDKVETFGKDVFEGCTQVSYLHIGKDFKSSWGDFYDCKALEYLQIDGQYPHMSFTRDQPRLKMVVLNGKWDYLSGFANCPELVTFKFPQSLHTIKSGSFYDCPKLMQVDIPEDIKVLEASVFVNTGIESVVIPETITEIQSTSFIRNKNLRYVYCGKNVKIIWHSAFRDCPMLETVDLCNVEQIYGNVFSGCGKLTNVIWSDKISMISRDVFSECDSLQSAFLAETLTYMDVGVFGNCDSLKTIVFRGNVPVFGYTQNFWNLNATVFYPADNDSWTEEHRHQYDGNLTWKSICTQHTAVELPSRAASCVQCGLTEGSTCQTCGWVINPQKIVEATSLHRYEAKVTEKSCTGGYTTHTCKECGSAYVDKFVECHPHEMNEWHIPPGSEDVIGASEISECEECDYFVYRTPMTYEPPAMWPYFEPSVKPTQAATTLSVTTLPTSTPTTSPTSFPTTVATTVPTSVSTTTVTATTEKREKPKDSVGEQTGSGVTTIILCVTAAGIVIFAISIGAKLKKREKE